MLGDGVGICMSTGSAAVILVLVSDVSQLSCAIRRAIDDQLLCASKVSALHFQL